MYMASCDCSGADLGKQKTTISTSNLDFTANTKVEVV
jgi:hypothetical protein